MQTGRNRTSTPKVNRGGTGKEDGGFLGLSALDQSLAGMVEKVLEQNTLVSHQNSLLLSQLGSHQLNNQVGNETQLKLIELQLTWCV